MYVHKAGLRALKGVARPLWLLKSNVTWLVTDLPTSVDWHSCRTLDAACPSARAEEQASADTTFRKWPFNLPPPDFTSSEVPSLWSLRAAPALADYVADVNTSVIWRIAPGTKQTHTFTLTPYTHSVCHFASGVSLRLAPPLVRNIENFLGA